MKEFIDKTATVDGTDMNRANLMAIQGFQGCIISTNTDGDIIITNADNHTLTLSYDNNGDETAVFEGEKTITKTTVIDDVVGVNIS